MRKVPSTGPSNADILIVGEAPNAKEEAEMVPFVGKPGVEMTRMLQEAGILRNACHITNVCPWRPPGNKIAAFFYNKTQAKKTEHINILNTAVHPWIAAGVTELEALISKLNPKLIIAFGNAPLWALTGEMGITKWRGSSLMSREINGKSYPVLPTYHPAAVLRRWDWRYIAVHDLRKAKHILDNGIKLPVERYEIRPSFSQAFEKLAQLTAKADALKEGVLDIAVDLETRFKQITCVGLAWSESDAICIPFLEMKAADRNYFSLDDELQIVLALRKLLTHPKVRVIGQNFSYDQQYFARRMGLIPNYKPDNFHDTMTAHHTMFAGLPKGLDFLSSFWCWEDHVYWKDEGKEWNPKHHDEERHWIYNCKDAARTYAVAQAQRASYASLNFKSTAYGDPWFIQHDSHESILRAMLRGVRIDLEKKALLQEELGTTITRLEEYMAKLLGHPLNPRSPKQLQQLFYNDFCIKKVTTYDRATSRRRATTGADALDTIAKREVLLAPICSAINDTRSLGTFKSVAAQELDVDSRIRCSYTVPGTETYRYNSREDAFGFGTNLQNVSSGDERHERDSHLYRPNLRKMFIPDKGYVLCDHDLDQADARIVAWESDCPKLKEIFNDPSRDLHNENCEIIFKKCTGKGDPNRQKAKMGVHAANYAATAPVIAAALGITIHQAEEFLRRYFGERPEVKEWHNTVALQLQSTRYVENVFGYRRYYFDRIDSLLKEALAWIPQSTVAIAINLGIKQVRDTLPWAEFLLQVHDSAVHQFPLAIAPPEESFESIRKTMEVPLPYEDPMTIPVSGEWSKESWGHCK